MNLEAYKEACAYQPGPGKFEGESLATIYYYYALLDGDGDFLEFPDGETLTIFEVDPDEAREFDFDLELGAYYIISVSEAGFVTGRTATEAEVASWRHEAETA